MREKLWRYLARAETLFGRPMTPVESADQFIELLPSLVDDLKWFERKPNKWVAGVYGLSNPRHDVWELRCMGRRVTFVRGFDEAITRADKHNRARVMAEFGLTIDPNAL